MQQEAEMIEDKRRDPLEIAIKIYEYIPHDKAEFKSDMDRLINDMFTKAPEIRLETNACWVKLDSVMHKHIPHPTDDWQWKMVDIYVGISK
jgi:hypothetical protein